MAKKILTILMALAIGFFGVLSISEASQPVNTAPACLNEISASGMEKGEVYLVEDLIIADTYAEMEDGTVMYFMTIFTDGSGSDVAITMPMNKSNPLWQQANAYLNDPDQYIGDLTVDCYVKVENNYASDDDLFLYFDEYVTDLRTSGYLLTSVSDLRLSYVCGPNEDPTADARGANTVGMVVGGVCIALALLMIVLALKGSRKPKAKAAPVQQNVYQPHVYETAPQAGSGDDVMVKLQQYQKIHAAGLMTDEEYEAKRKQLLGL